MTRDVSESNQRISVLELGSVRAFRQELDPMTTFTPRGLKLRLPPSVVFGLVSRLFPRVDAFHVLRLTECVDNMPGVATLTATAVAFFFHFPPFQVALVVAVAHIASRLAHLNGLFFFPFNVALSVSRFVAPITGWGFLPALVLGFGWYSSGWQVVAAYFVARTVAGVIMLFLELSAAKRIHSETGMAISASERSFFHAYRLTADKLRAPTDLEMSDHEMEEQTWNPVLLDYMQKYPEVAHRTIR